MNPTRLSDWGTVAINLPEHADNPIHTDEGARAAGFERALVAGVSTYALLTHVPTVGWGRAWLGDGGGRVGFRHPVFDQDRVVCTVDRHSNPSATDSSATVAAVVNGETRATLELFPRPDIDTSIARRHQITERPILSDPLVSVERRLDEQWATYGTRLGSDATATIDPNLIHPATWLAIANNIFHTQVVDGPWIHTGSLIAHDRPAFVGETVNVMSTVVDRFATRVGDRAIADVQIIGEHGPIARIEHEAVIRLARSDG